MSSSAKKTMNECQFHSQKKSCVVVTLNFKRGERENTTICCSALMLSKNVSSSLYCLIVCSLHTNVVGL